MNEALANAIRRPAIIAAVWICALLVMLGTFAKMPPQWRGRDFSDKYESAWALRHGIDPYSSDLTPVAARLGLETGGLIHASDTPPFLLCFKALTTLRPRPAFWVWTLFNAAALAAAMYLLLAYRPGLPAQTAWMLAGLVLMWAPVSLNFYWGQSQLIILMLFVAAMRSMERNADGTAGALIAIAALLRAYPIILAGYFIVRRRWRALAFFAATFAAGISTTIAMLGLGQSMSFIHGARWVAGASLMSRVDNLSLGPFVSRLVWSAAGGNGSSPYVESIRRASVAATDLLVLGLTVHASLRVPRRGDPDWRIYSLWIATAIMLSPVGWHHYLVLLVIPFVQIAASAENGRCGPAAIWMAVACWLLTPISLRAFNRFLVPPPTAFQLALPSLARALTETGFVAMLAGYVATYLFATASIARRCSASFRARAFAASSPR